MHQRREPLTGASLHPPDDFSVRTTGDWPEFLRLALALRQPHDWLIINRPFSIVKMRSLGERLHTLRKVSATVLRLSYSNCQVLTIQQKVKSPCHYLPLQQSNQ